MAFSQRPKASRSGVLEPLPSALMRAKAGNSSSCRRIQIDTPSSRIESRNGTRQPQSANCAGVSHRRSPRTTISERNRPTVAVVWIHEV